MCLLCCFQDRTKTNGVKNDSDNNKINFNIHDVLGTYNYHFTYLLSFYSGKDIMPILQMRNGSFETLGNLPKVTEIIRAGADI